MISVIVRIPASLLQNHVIPLLEIEDLVRIDTAVLNRNARKLFLEQLQGARLMTDNYPLENQIAQWLLNRNIWIPDLNFSKKAMDLSIVKQFAATLLHDTGLNFDDCKNVTNETVIEFAKACKNVKSMSLRGLYEGSSVVESIAQSCPNLQAINISDSTGIKDLTFLTIGCKFLSELALNNCSWMNNDLTTAIAENCPQLQKLSLDSCKKCGDKTLQVLAQHCHELHYLSLRGLHLLTDEGISALAGSCAKLRTIFLFYNERITSDGIIALAQGCTKLEEIGIPICDKHIDLAVAALVQHCSALNTIRCYSSHITDQSLQHLQNCPQFNTLVTSGSKFSTTALMLFLNNCANVKSLETFKGILKSDILVNRAVSNCLDNMGSIQFKYCEFLTDSFIPIVLQCPNLTELNLKGCTGLTDAAVLAVALNCRKLQKLNLARMLVTDAPVCAIAESCPDLHSICITSCSLLTDTTAIAIAEHCPYLKHFDMSFCTTITDIGIVEILRKCRKLRELELSNCNLNTTRVVDAAVLYGSRLRKLDLFGFTRLPTAAVKAFHATKPRCKLLVGIK